MKSNIEDLLAFLLITAAVTELLTPDTEWRRQRIGIGVQRYPLDPDNNPHDRVKPNYAKEIERQGNSVTRAINSARGFTKS